MRSESPPKKRTIAMIAPMPYPSHQGTQVVVRHVASALARAGHEVHLVTYGYGEHELEGEPPYHLHRPLKIDAGLRSGPSLLRPAADTALMFTAAKVVKAFGCELMHVHNVEGLALGALLKLQASVPLVYHSHNAMGPELPTYFRAHFAQAFASVVGDVLDKTLPRAADAVITFDSDHKALHEVYGIPEDRLHVIPPGLEGDEIRAVNPTDLARMREAMGPGPWLLYAGNPDGYQNLPLMWAAFERVRFERPDVKLLVATSHEAASFAADFAGGHEVPGVRFLRYEGLAELRAIFAACDVGLSPRSLWAGAPIKVLNYLAAGLPVVAVRSGARHVLNDAGGVFTKDDAEDFAQGIFKVLDQGPRTAAKRRRAFERFHIDAHVPLYEAVYDRVLGV